MTLKDLKGRGAVVMGGGSGMGRAIAHSLGVEGAHVLVADINEDKAAAVAEEVRQAGGNAFSTRADATDRSSLAAVAALAMEELGQVNLLVHMVGIISDAAVTTSSDDDWAWFMDFNLMAAVRSVEAFLPSLRTTDEAHIMVTASMAGLSSIPVEMSGGLKIGLYTVSKHAALAFGEMLHHELAAEGIGVSVLCPGVVHTDLDANSANNRPARFGGPMPQPKELDIPVSARMKAEDVGPIVVRGILANRKYIFTHPHSVEMLQTFSIKPLLEDFKFAARTISE